MKFAEMEPDKVALCSAKGRRPLAERKTTDLRSSVTTELQPGVTGQRCGAKYSKSGSAAGRPAVALIVFSLVFVGIYAAVDRTVTADEPKPSDGAAAASSYQIGGHYDCIARYAHPSNTPAHGGYYVGGGATFHGEERFADEGTWGWDYFGRHFSRRIDLGWWHGTHYQGGIGAYKTDGPKLVH
jgi:hypothetical protein